MRWRNPRFAHEGNANYAIAYNKRSKGVYPVKPAATIAKAPSTARIDSTSPALGLPLKE